MSNSLSLVIPTHSPRRPLERCLRTVFWQLQPQDEVIVVGDTRDGPLPSVQLLVEGFGHQFRYYEHDGGRMSWGHDQVNYGFRMAHGDWLHANDDDDAYTPDALSSFRQAIAQYGETAMLFRFQSYVGNAAGRLVFWLERGLYGRNMIGGHCLLQPNVTGKIGWAGEAYNGDFDMVDGAVQAWGGPETVPWVDSIIAVARP